jgi:lipid II:glycine glycyltransferase (peptidoglycan interpeptide bridge formation enzyme)
MQGLDDFCRRYKAAYAQIYPHEVTSELTVVNELEELGFTSPPLFTGHRFSSTPVTIDLVGKREEDILKCLRKKTRQYVRVALDSELSLSTDVNQIVFNEIYELFREHGALLGYQPRPYASIKASWDWLAPKGWAHFIQAWHNKTLVGAILLVFTGRTAYYLAGAVRRGFEKHRPGEFVHWHGIRKAIASKLNTYDLVNLGPPGVEQFKRGFRPQLQMWHAPRSKIYRPPIAWMAGVADHYLRPVLRNIARRRANRQLDSIRTFI